MHEAVHAWIDGQQPPPEATKALFHALVVGKLDDIELCAALVALKARGESAIEIGSAAQAVLEAATPFPRPDGLFADCAGTGGDRLGTFNVSTAVAFTAAAAGLPVVKHGNRSVSSQCGSADVLERLGARIDPAPEVARRALDRTRVCFLFAPSYHPGLRHAAKVRRTLATPTVMNLLGPLVNPARPPIQLVGVYHPRWLEPVARVLSQLGVQRALVVHGGGLDEIALHATTQAIEVGPDGFRPLTLHPRDAGLETAALSDLQGGDPEANAQGLRRLLQGQGPPAQRDSVALNTGALLWLSGRADDLRQGVGQALEALRGEAYRVLERFVEETRG
ncbi:MAG: anthranilate phosphoribosyltransferase [Proteobacteria bacterium]|nr:anthranilate phosphoribosyltransferase [Pseudomonadota bacterium]